MLSGYADIGSNINSGVESLIPLFIGKSVLVERVERALFLLYGCVWVLVLSLCEYGLFDQLE
jgi:hypothetical protein